MSDAASDATRDFERIFGKRDNAAANNASEQRKDALLPSAPEKAGKLPSDSDVLGIRTDSDRFIVKQMPERLPTSTSAVPKPTVEVTPGSGPTKLVFDVVPPGSQEAMTIALNVSVVPKQASAASPPSAANPSKAEVSFTRAFTGAPVAPAVARPPAAPAVFPAPLPSAANRPQNHDGFDQLLASRQDTWMQSPARAVAPLQAETRAAFASETLEQNAEPEPARFSRVMLTVLLLNGLLLIAVLLVVSFALHR